MNDKLQNPKEAICLLLYGQPDHVENLSIRMYDKRNSRVPKWKQELKQEGKIKRMDYYDDRFQYYQTKPKTIYDYIINNLDKDNTLTSKKSSELLSYLKTDDFKQFVKEFIEMTPIKSEFFTFTGLVEYFSFRCLHILNVAKYYKAKGFDITDKSISESFNKPENLTFAQLGFELLVKLANLNTRSFLINHHYERFVEMVETFNQVEIQTLQDKLKKPNGVNSNGHGLN